MTDQGEEVADDGGARSELLIDDPSPAQFFGKTWLQDWARRLESERDPDRVSIPVTAERLADQLDAMAMLSNELMPQFDDTPDGAIEISSDQKRARLKYLLRARAALEAYDRLIDETIGTKSQDGDFPSLPPSDTARKAIDLMIAEIKSVAPRGQARPMFNIMTNDAGKILKALTGKRGRSVDRVTGVESELLFDFSFGLIKFFAPDLSDEKIASRVRTAMR